MDKNLINRMVSIDGKEGEITNIVGQGYEVTFFDLNNGKAFVNVDDIEKYLLPQIYDESSEHPVWKILDKEKYVEEFYTEVEELYDFIKKLVSACGTTIKDGDTVPTMKVFLDMWNEHSSETFWILDRLVNTNSTL